MPTILLLDTHVVDWFPQDPSDRVIYVTAIEHGLQLVTRDERLRQHRYPRRITVW